MTEACLKIYTKSKKDDHVDNEQRKLYMDMFRHSKKDHEWPRKQTDESDTSSTSDEEKDGNGSHDDAVDSCCDAGHIRTLSPPPAPDAPEAAPTYDRAMSRSTTQPALHVAAEAIVVDDGRTPSPPPAAEASPTYARALSRSVTQPALFVAAETIVAPPATDYRALLATAEARIVELEAQLTDAKTGADASKARVADIEAKLAESQARAEALEARAATLDGDVASLQTQLEASRADGDKLLADLNRANQETQTKRGERDEARTDLCATRNELTAERERSNVLTAQATTLRTDLLAALARADALAADNATHQSVVHALQQTLNATVAKRVELRRADAARAASLQCQLIATHEELAAATRALTADIEALRAKHAEDIDATATRLRVEHDVELTKLKEEHQDAVDAAFVNGLDQRQEPPPPAVYRQKLKDNVELIDALQAELRRREPAAAHIAEQRRIVLVETQHARERAALVEERAHHLGAELERFAGDCVSRDAAGALLGVAAAAADIVRRSKEETKALIAELQDRHTRAEARLLNAARIKQHRRAQKLRASTAEFKARRALLANVRANSQHLRTDARYLEVFDQDAEHNLNFETFGGTLGHHWTIARVAEDMNRKFSSDHLFDIGCIAADRYYAAHGRWPATHKQTVMGGAVANIHTYVHEDLYMLRLSIEEFERTGARPRRRY